MKNLILISSFFLVVNSHLWAGDCPEGAHKLEFTMEYEPQKHVLCEKTFNGKNLKHGPYKKYHSSGKLVEEKFYKKGKEVKRPLPSKAKVDQKLPQIGELFKVLIPGKKPDHQSFNTNNCKANELGWVMLFMMQKSFTEKYSFGQNCDVEGQYRPKLKKYFNIELKLKNFEGYNKVKMNLKININPNREILIHVKEGILYGNKEIHFKGTYQGRVRLSSKNIEFINQGGRIFIYQINGKKVNLSQKIYVK